MVPNVRRTSHRRAIWFWRENYEFVINTFLTLYFCLFWKNRLKVKVIHGIFKKNVFYWIFKKFLYKSLKFKPNQSNYATQFSPKSDTQSNFRLHDIYTFFFLLKNFHKFSICNCIWDFFCIFFSNNMFCMISVFLFSLQFVTRRNFMHELRTHLKYT